MKYLPLHHRFAGRRCLIIGGGGVAAKRARRVLDSGGRVDVIARELGIEMKALGARMAAAGGEVAVRPFARGDVAEHYALVVAATDDHALNREIADDARRRAIPVNVATDAALCDVVFPLTIDRAPLTITVASGAASPTLTRLLGNRIDSLVPRGYGELAQLVGRFRKRAQAKIPDTAARIRFWENILQGVVAESVFSGNADEAEALLTQALERAVSSSSSPPALGEVYLIGAGPGDPDLLTLRAFRLLQQADVVLYDRLVAPQILEQLAANGERELVYVGKRRAEHAVAQPGINRMLSDYARRGKRVARLKGGDPFIFGRGGEEIEHLASEQIPFQVIPGITAANGCASYAGIPLTHRAHAQSVRFVTGQLRDGGVDLDWQSLVAPGQTLVFYMSLNGLPLICENLLAHGLAADLPVALIEKGTTLRQKVYVSTLGEMRGVLAANDIRAPTIFIAGTVVSLRRSLKWFGGDRSDRGGVG